MPVLRKGVAAMRVEAIDPVAVLCAKMCEASYLDFKGAEFKETMSALGFSSLVKTVENAGVEAFAVANDEEMVVCFRGTDSGADWLADASCGKTVFGRAGVLVHTGFMRTLMVVERDIVDFVLSNVGSRKIYVCGHSLGAAMAVLFSMRWLTNSIDAVVTFGCPRVGNKAFADEYNRVHSEHSLRFVNNNDAVTRIPLKMMGFDHVWRMQYFDRRGKLHAEYRPNFLKKAWDGFAGRVRNLGKRKLGDGIWDHSIHDYRRLCEKNTR